jgi:hypothetical protein
MLLLLYIRNPHPPILFQITIPYPSSGPKKMFFLTGGAISIIVIVKSEALTFDLKGGHIQ